MCSLAPQLSLERNMNHQVANNMTGQTGKKNTAVSTYQYKRSYAPVGPMAVGQINNSRSEPDLVWQRSAPKRSVPPRRLLSSRSTQMTERSTSQQIRNSTSQILPVYTLNGIGQTKTNTQFVCSPVDVSKTSSKPPVTEFAQKSKGGSG